MSSFRITTNGLYRNYRTNLTKNNQKLNSAMISVETQRKFNSYAEDPAAASKAWRLRRSYWRTNDQIDNNNYIISKYESAYSAMAAIVDGDAGNGDSGLGLDAIMSTITAVSDGSGAARNALGKQLIQTADNIVSMMNSKYGDEFVFAGADGARLPFEWNEDHTKLLYRNVDVNAAEGTSDYEKLQAMAEETTYMDIGLGLDERGGELIEGSAFNSAVSGLSFLGYGEDQNLVVVIKELGDIYSRTDPDTGEYSQVGDAERASELFAKLRDAVRNSQGQHTQLSADAKYLKRNLQQLETNRDQLNEQIVDTEDMDMADAITNMTWAQYCYNAALRIGTNILSQSLLDYMS